MRYLIFCIKTKSVWELRGKNENPNFTGTPCRFGGQPLSIDSLEKLIDKAFTPKKLEAVFLSINSPGGSPVQSELIVRHILFQKKDGS